MKLFFTRRAEQNYQAIKRYLIRNWSVKVARAFEEKTTDFLNLLEEFPEIGTVEVEEKQIRGFQLTTQTRIFYRIKDGRIIILALFDVRQNPKKKDF